MPTLVTSAPVPIPVSSVCISMLYILELSRMLYATLVSVPVPVSSVCISVVYPVIISVIIFQYVLDFK